MSNFIFIITIGFYYVYSLLVQYDVLIIIHMLSLIEIVDLFCNYFIILVKIEERYLKINFLIVKTIYLFIIKNQILIYNYPLDKNSLIHLLIY